MNAARPIMFGAAVLLAVSGVAGAGIISDPGSLGPAWQGKAVFTGFALAIDVEYCVYDKGQFGLVYPGQDPSNGQHYVYAYEAYNLGTAHISSLSVGLNPSNEDEQVASIGHVAGTNDRAPDMAEFKPVPPTVPTSAVWTFNDPVLGGLNPGEVSSILIFTSPFGPEDDTCSVVGAYGWNVSTQYMPSPKVPEPASVTLLAMAAIAFCSNKGRRK